MAPQVSPGDRHGLASLCESEEVSMYAVIETGGKQYRVSEQDVLRVEKLNAEEGEEVTFQVVAIGQGADVKVGTPYVEGATVKAKVVSNGKGKKLYVNRYKPKKNEKKRIGHRQPYSEVQIVSVNG